MAAEVLVQAGARVDLFDAMASVGRKFLLAGKGGLNLTHAEPSEPFRSRYGARAPEVSRWLDAFGPQDLRDWAAGLGIPTFVGSSGKVFPAEMKAAPLLRAWLHRLRAAGVRFHMRHHWNGVLLPVEPARPAVAGDAAASACVPAPAAILASTPAATVSAASRRRWQLGFDTPAGLQHIEADAVILALGGASWARLGSDGAWQPWLRELGAEVAPLQPANCGFDIGWSPYLTERHAGAPLKGVRLAFTDRLGRRFDRLGEAVLTAHGIEGNLVYAASAWLRDEIAACGRAEVRLDLLPARDGESLRAALARGRGARSLINHLREHTGLHGAKAALLREGLDAAQWAALSSDAGRLAERIKALPLTLLAPRPIDEAISSAGGVCFETMDARLMLHAAAGVFCAGEMVDWEAPTGGYLLTASLSGGRWAGQGVLDWWATATPAG